MRNTGVRPTLGTSLPGDPRMGVSLPGVLSTTVWVEDRTLSRALGTGAGGRKVAVQKDSVGTGLRWGPGRGRMGWPRLTLARARDHSVLLKEL